MIYGKRSRLFAVFFLGLITGASLLNLLLGNHLEKANLDIQNLHNKVSEQQAQIESLQVELDIRQPILVKELRVYVMTEDKYVKMETANFAKEILKNLIGKEVENLNPILVSNILNNRVVEIDKTPYSLKVEAVLVSERIVVYIHVEKEKL